MNVKPWLKYDLMHAYRKTINREDEELVMLNFGVTYCSNFYGVTRLHVAFFCIVTFEQLLRLRIEVIN